MEIVGGFRFPSGSLEEASAVVARFRDVLRPLHMQAMCERLAERATGIIDECACRDLMPWRTGVRLDDPVATEWLRIAEAARQFAERFGQAAFDGPRKAATFALAHGFVPPPLGLPWGEGGAAFLAEAAVADLDQIRGRANGARGPLAAARNELLDGQRGVRRSGLRSPDYDFGFELALIPHGGAVLGIAYVERVDWLDLWFSMDGVERYGYWPGTPAAGVSREAWEARRAVWEAALGPRGTPSLVCLSAEVTDTRCAPGKEEIPAIVDAQPPFDARVTRMAEMIVVERRVNEREAMGAPVDDPHEFVRMHMDALRWLRTGEGRSAVGAAAGEVARLLRPRLSADDLLRGVPAPGANPATPGPGPIC